MRICPHCSAKVQNSEVICPHCKKKVLTIKSRTTAIILAIFTGFIGGHKFYTGKNLWGILYLIFCWTSISGIVGIIEAIRWALMPEWKFNEEVNHIIPTEEEKKKNDGKKSGIVVLGIVFGTFLLLVVMGFISDKEDNPQNLASDAVMLVDEEKPVSKPVTITPLKSDEAIEIKEAEQKVEIKDSIGEWDNYLGDYYYGKIVILENDGSYSFEIRYEDGSKTTGELSKNGGKFLKQNNKAGEYYVIEKNGNLGLYDNEGKFGEAIPPAIQKKLKTEKEEFSKKINDYERLAGICSRTYIESLIAPKPADFPIKNAVFDEERNLFRISSYVDSVNGFNAPTRQRYYCEISGVDLDSFTCQQHDCQWE